MYPADMFLLSMQISYLILSNWFKCYLDSSLSFDFDINIWTPLPMIWQIKCTTFLWNFTNHIFLILYWMIVIVVTYQTHHYWHRWLDCLLSCHTFYGNSHDQFRNIWTLDVCPWIGQDIYTNWSWVLRSELREKVNGIFLIASAHC